MRVIDKLEPTIFVIFGITGDLAQRKLLPAIYHLIKDGLLHEHTAIVGVSRRDITVAELLNQVELCVLEADNVCDETVLEKFRYKLRMIRFDPVKDDDYDTLLQTLNDIEDKHDMCMNRLYYLSIPPQVYEPVIRNFGTHHLNEGCQHKKAVSRLLVEKPFGYDLESAKDLIEITSRYFSEDQIFRIDHYLAKETVQNILVFRNHNPIFTSLWDHHHISAIDISLSEQLGVEGRAEFYDNVGALRDIVQNHLLQLLALVTMELPKSIHNSAALHQAKQALLASIPPLNMANANVTRAQYVGYREEVKNPRSTTETFVSLTLTIDSERWQSVPITIRTGKALKAKRSTIVITFASPAEPDTTNKLTFRIQPNEGIDVELIVKRPGFEDKIEIVQMDFSYRGVFSEPEHPDAYERVLVDAIKGDHSLFATSEEVLAAWHILQPILDAWERTDDDLLIYELGSDGPSASMPAAPVTDSQPT
jgi:glucose-6-phosphate 1-dehydrogenase